jgi:hypothetical protein
MDSNWSDPPFHPLVGCFVRLFVVALFANWFVGHLVGLLEQQQPLIARTLHPPHN